MAVGNDMVQKAGTLSQTLFQIFPIGGRYHHRHRVELPLPRLSTTLTLNIVGNALLEHHPSAGFPAPAQTVLAKGSKRFQQRGVARANGTATVHQLVVSISRRLVIPQQLVECGGTYNRAGTACFGGNHDVRRSKVNGCSGSTGGRLISTRPAVCPWRKNRASLRPSASYEFTGNASKLIPPGWDTW